MYSYVHVMDVCISIKDICTLCVYKEYMYFYVHMRGVCMGYNTSVHMKGIYKDMVLTGHHQLVSVRLQHPLHFGNLSIKMIVLASEL